MKQRALRSSDATEAGDALAAPGRMSATARLGTVRGAPVNAPQQDTDDVATSDAAETAPVLVAHELDEPEPSDRLLVSPERLDLPATLVGRSSTRGVEFEKNKAVVTHHRITGDFKATPRFVFGGVVDSEPQPGVDITFAPTSTGPHNGTLSLQQLLHPDENVVVPVYADAVTDATRYVPPRKLALEQASDVLGGTELRAVGGYLKQFEARQAALGGDLVFPRGRGMERYEARHDALVHIQKLHRRIRKLEGGADALPADRERTVRAAGTAASSTDRGWITGQLTNAKAEEEKLRTLAGEATLGLREVQRDGNSLAAELASLEALDLDRDVARTEEEVARAKDRADHAGGILGGFLKGVGAGLRFVGELKDTLSNPFAAAGEAAEALGELVSTGAAVHALAKVKALEDKVARLADKRDAKRREVLVQRVAAAREQLAISWERRAEALRKVVAQAKIVRGRYHTLGQVAGKHGGDRTMAGRLAPYVELGQIVGLLDDVAPDLTSLHVVDEPQTVRALRLANVRDAELATWAEDALPALADALQTLAGHYRARLGDAEAGLAKLDPDVVD